MKDKRLRLIYLTIILWLAFAIIGICFKHYGINIDITLSNLAVYFVSLSTFIGSYLFSESYRSSEDKTPMFKKGPTSKREILINITVLLWFILGVIGLYRKMDINDLTAYFGVLTPFVGGYIIAEGLKKDAVSTVNESEKDDTTKQESI